MLAEASAATPACEPVISAISDLPRPTAKAERLYITGNDILANRTYVDASSYAPGEVRSRFQALEAAVHGGCHAFVIRSTGWQVNWQVQQLPFESGDAPVVAFQLTTSALTGTRNRRVYLYAAVGDNRLIFMKGDDVTNNPTLPSSIVQAQIHKIMTVKTATPATSAPTQ
ncbi:hypothetical protein GCM10009760_64670 [Kitasatospora kazusensis]|uniref:Lipoprotein n=2 Tax=Kitasatospora kazusensis TaxID=407974 RepID=A0ABN1ZP14_9ACTN